MVNYQFAAKAATPSYTSAIIGYLPMIGKFPFVFAMIASLRG